MVRESQIKAGSNGHNMDSGKWIRELREDRFVKSSDIERVSRSIADLKGNADFYVSHSTLADIETVKQEFQIGRKKEFWD